MNQSETIPNTLTRLKYSINYIYFQKMYKCNRNKRINLILKKNNNIIENNITFFYIQKNL